MISESIPDASPAVRGWTPASRQRGNILLCLALFGSVVLLLVSGRAFPVALPMLAVANLGFGFVMVIWDRDGQLPVFELGTVVVVVTTLYTFVPLLNFWVGGLQWSVLSDNRLYQYQSTPREVGAFAWRHVLYLASFVIVYLAARGRVRRRYAGLTGPDRAATIVLIGLLLAFTLFFRWVENAYMVSFNPAYSDVRAGLVILPTELPYVLQQIASYGQGILLVVKMGLLILLFRRWRSKMWRVVLVVWLLGEVLTTALRLGARTDTAMLLLSAILLYHRLVKPLTFRMAVLVGVGFLAAIVLYGFAREFSTEAPTLSATMSATNEFQGLFGTAYDLYRRKMAGGLVIPEQLYISDLYLLVPSRLTGLLPFYNWDPSDWYSDVIGMRGSGVGFMFGVISQAVIGLDWAELMLRGAVLGGLFARIHRGYVRRSSRFWPTMFYLYLCLWGYYTFRASTFYFLYFVVYRFVPTLLIVEFGRALLKAAVRRPAHPDLDLHSAT